MLQPDSADDLLVGFETRDDAAVYRISEDQVVLLTVDFFTPVVDEPYDFGRITAANALSDIYAMGGRPLAAMNLLAFPCGMSPQVIGDVLRGGADKVREAGAVTVGGHTIDDSEPKYGLAVMGVAHPEGIVRNVGARPDDALVLTKPIGAGVLTTALKRGLETQEGIAEVIEAMAALNRAASEAMLEVGVHAATDVTGFGLLGHLHEMLDDSDVCAEVELASVPVFDRALEYSRRGVRPGRTAEVIEHLDRFVDWGEADESWKGVLADPQTSGGLLIALEPARLPQLLDLISGSGGSAWVIGSVEEGEPGTISVR
ncbi:MAG: selenide, water dikinase SelD [Coriobacteriia bacterium]